MKNKYYINQKIQLNTYDIDVAGHINNIVYIKWIEKLRTKLFIDFFDFEKIINSNYYPVVISTNIEYKKQIRLFDEVNAKFWLEKFERSIWVFNCNIETNGNLAAKSIQKCVLLELKENKIVNPSKFI